MRKNTEMTTRKKATTGKGEKKRKSQKATIKDLHVRGVRGGSVKGGEASTGAGAGHIKISQ